MVISVNISVLLKAGVSLVDVTKNRKDGQYNILGITFTFYTTDQQKLPHFNCTDFIAFVTKFFKCNKQLLLVNLINKNAITITQINYKKTVNIYLLTEYFTYYPFGSARRKAISKTSHTHSLYYINGLNSIVYSLNKL